MKLFEQSSKAENAIRQALNKLRDHGILTMKLIKKAVFIRDHLQKMVGSDFDRVSRRYSEISQSELSVYMFNIDLMLVLKARVFTLRQNALTKVLLLPG